MADIAVSSRPCDEVTESQKFGTLWCFRPYDLVKRPLQDLSPPTTGLRQTDEYGKTKVLFDTGLGKETGRAIRCTKRSS